jgi:hypothetical protein
MSYDTKCHELAVLFLKDNDAEGSLLDTAAHDLAQQIQDLIDGFIEFDLVELGKEASAEDHRLDDPRHGQAEHINRMR